MGCGVDCHVRNIDGTVDIIQGSCPLESHVEPVSEVVQPDSSVRVVLRCGRTAIFATSITRLRARLQTPPFLPPMTAAAGQFTANSSQKPNTFPSCSRIPHQPPCRVEDQLPSHYRPAGCDNYFVPPNSSAASGRYSGTEYSVLLISCSPAAAATYSSLASSTTLTLTVLMMPRGYASRSMSSPSNSISTHQFIE